MAVINRLVENLELALIAEFMAKKDALQAAVEAEESKAFLLLMAYEGGIIAGKNADIRRQQEARHLACAPHYQDRLVYQQELEMCAAVAEAERRAIEAEISLTRAFWYSTGGGGCVHTTTKDDIG